ncbi:NfeD family protein [Caldisphaera sp.]|uniref:NfeD family protein n=1 Tax=Caldisphaera sp. TaxID=2060322 RepID=UPI003D104B27
MEQTKKYIMITLLLIMLILLTKVNTTNSAIKKPVIIVNFDVPVDIGSSDMMQRALTIAQSYNASAIVIVMNTPGGYLSDMINIVNIIEEANKSGIPTYTYVPPNSLAASAGSYIAMATNQIIMGTGSEIGPSTPIVVGGSQLEQNHTEDAMISFMQSLAQKWGRNTTAATNMVLYDIAYSSSQAYQYHLINGISDSLSSALQSWNLTNNPQIHISEDFYEQFLSAISNSTVDGILMTLGFLAILLDLYHPTIFLTVIGIIAIIAGLVGAEIISASLLGITLIIIGAAIMLIELKLGHGFALMAGTIVSALGIYFMAEGIPFISTGVPNGYISQLEITGVGAVGIVAGLYIRWIAGPLRKKEKLAGPESLIGKKGVVISPLNPEGEVKVEGIVWKAICESCTANQGEMVEVLRIEGLKLIVKKIESK